MRSFQRRRREPVKTDCHGRSDSLRVPRMSYEQLLYATDNRVATITLNRPERHNALSQLLVDEIMAAVAEADADPEVRVVILTGTGGKAFSAGYDIKESA